MCHFIWARAYRPNWSDTEFSHRIQDHSQHAGINPIPTTEVSINEDDISAFDQQIQNAGTYYALCRSNVHHAKRRRAHLSRSHVGFWDDFRETT